jgi:hypothetical protein
MCYIYFSKKKTFIYPVLIFWLFKANLQQCANNNSFEYIAWNEKFSKKLWQMFALYCAVYKVEKKMQHI